jgi:hypothetical protein
MTLSPRVFADCPAPGCFSMLPASDASVISSVHMSFWKEVDRLMTTGLPGSGKHRRWTILSGVFLEGGDVLTIEDLQVELAGKILLRDINLEIRPGKTHILFGPNGSGKTSLLMAFMRYPQYEVRRGRIAFKGQDITHASIDERARLGIGMSCQRPPTIKGLATRQMVEICAKSPVDAGPIARSVNFEEFLDRDVSAGFSGDEIKRSEILQLMAEPRSSPFRRTRIGGRYRKHGPHRQYHRPGPAGVTGGRQNGTDCGALAQTDEDGPDHHPYGLRTR